MAWYNEGEIELQEQLAYRRLSDSDRTNTVIDAYRAIEYLWDDQHNCSDGTVTHPVEFTVIDAEKVLTDRGYVFKQHCWVKNNGNDGGYIQTGIWYKDVFWIRA